jgi:hypothetical protein
MWIWEGTVNGGAATTSEDVFCLECSPPAGECAKNEHADTERSCETVPPKMIGPELVGE